MHRLLRTHLLTGLLVVGLVLLLTPRSGLAQDKKDKRDAKADEIGVTEVYMAKDGWRFRIKNAEGKSIAIGTVGHDKKEDAEKTVELVRHTLTKGKVVVLKEEKK